MIGFPIGLLYCNAGEWLIHKYILHERGKDRRSFYAYHWHDHHRAARKNDQYDPAYARWHWRWDPRSKEVVGLIGLAALHAPLFPVAPFFVGAVWFSQANYYRVHKKSHQDPAWGRKHLPWHVDHHLGPDQNANWCVTWPWFDWVMGTRKKFVGTEAELKKPQRRGGEQADRGGEQQQVAGEQAG